MFVVTTNDVTKLGWRTRTMTLDEVLNAIEEWGPELLTGLLDAIFGADAISKIPVEALAKTAANIAEALNAKTEKEAMQDAVNAVDEEIKAEQKVENELVGS